MTALATDRLTKFAGPYPGRGTYGTAANVRLFKGAMLALDSAGRVVPGGALSTGALTAIGKCSAQYDNRTGSVLGGAADAANAECEYGVFGWANSAAADAITVANVGQVCFMVDDQTVALTSAGGTRGPAGIVSEVRGTLVYVVMGPDIVGFIAQDVAAAAVTQFRARNIVNGNVASLAAYTVAANTAVNDNVLNVAGDLVLLVAQSTPAQNGLYAVGTVAAGVAPLTRVSTMAAGLIFLADGFQINVAEGDVFAHTVWFNSAAGTIATNTPAFMPECVTLTQALVAGTMTITSVPILSATRTGFTITRTTPNTSALTVMYSVNANPTPGALGTASAVVFATVAAGTINNADISGLHLTITNR
jgi:hypothetical protein